MDNYIIIPLTQSKETIVDSIDADLAQYKWYARCDDGRWYAARGLHENGKTKTIYLHRVILERKLERLLGKNDRCDHVSTGETLNNTRQNIRLATSRQNSQNSKIKTSNKSGYKGVWWNKVYRKWSVAIRDGDGKRVFLGNFENIRNAAQAYADAAEKYHDEFKRLK